MVPVSLTTLLVAILSVSAARNGVSKNKDNRKVQPVCKEVKKADYYRVPLTPMTALTWVRIAANSNNQAMKILKSQGTPSLPYTLLSNAQQTMQPASEHILHVITALTFGTQSLKALLNVTETWNSEHNKAAKHLTSAVVCLVLAAELKTTTPNTENQLVALKLFDEEDKQPETGKNAVDLADKVLSRIATKVPRFNMPPALPTPQHSY